MREGVPKEGEGTALGRGADGAPPHLLHDLVVGARRTTTDNKGVRELESVHLDGEIGAAAVNQVNEKLDRTSHADFRPRVRTKQTLRQRIPCDATID